MDVVEEMFSEGDQARSQVGVKIALEKGAMKSIFPLCDQDGGLDEQWPWGVCGGLIGGPWGSRLCTKLIEDTNVPR